MTSHAKDLVSMRNLLLLLLWHNFMVSKCTTVMQKNCPVQEWAVQQFVDSSSVEQSLNAPKSCVGSECISGIYVVERRIHGQFRDTSERDRERSLFGNHAYGKDNCPPTLAPMLQYTYIAICNRLKKKKRTNKVWRQKPTVKFKL